MIVNLLKLILIPSHFQNSSIPQFLNLAPIDTLSLLFTLEIGSEI
jgi:hypothetical protein